MVKEKLAKLLENCPYLDILGGLSYWDEAAEHLLANGVRLETKEATSDKTSDKTSDDTMTNGDKIRAMDDKTLARQLLSVINEAVEAMTGDRLSDEISDVFEGQLLAKLILPVEEHND